MCGLPFLALSFSLFASDGNYDCCSETLILRIHDGMRKLYRNHSNVLDECKQAFSSNHLDDPLNWTVYFRLNMHILCHATQQVLTSQPLPEVEVCSTFHNDFQHFATCNAIGCLAQAQYGYSSGNSIKGYDLRK